MSLKTAKKDGIWLLQYNNLVIYIINKLLRYITI